MAVMTSTKRTPTAREAAMREATRPLPVSIDDVPQKAHRVLVADDEHLVASGIQQALKEAGFDVIGPAGDGEEAIALCERQRPDIAVLDIRMPRRDGLSAAEVIYGRLGVPVIILTAYSDSTYVDQTNRIGVFGYLLKPITQDQLTVEIQVAWGRYRDSLMQRGEIGDLKERLENRKIVEQAKWILVKRQGLEEPEAMRLLQKSARNTRRTLIDIARSVIDGHPLPA